jgi:integrase
MTKGRGTVERRQGSWSYRFSYTDTARKRHSVRRQGFATKHDAQVALAAHLNRVDNSRTQVNDRTLTGDYLRSWLAAYVRSGSRKATTVEVVSTHVNAYLIPRIGLVPIGKLTATVIAGLYSDLQTDGHTGKNGTGGLSAKTVRNIAGTLHKALTDGVKRELLARNPAANVDLPRAIRPELNVWDEQQVSQFLSHVMETGDPCAPLWRLLLATGLRRGELLGLTWADVDLVDGSVAVRQSRTVKGIDSPKTKRGRRTIALDPDTIVELAQLKNAQEQAAAELGGWTSPFIATDLDGRAIQPLAFTRRFQAAAKRAGLPVPRLHDGRHTAATLALQNGVPIHVVSGRLGHEKVSTTLDVYAAFLPTADRLAADTIGRLLTPSNKARDAQRTQRDANADKTGPTSPNPDGLPSESFTSSEAENGTAPTDTLEAMLGIERKNSEVEIPSDQPQRRVEDA